MSKDCRLQFAGDIIPESGFGLGLKKGSLLKNEISEMIRKYEEDGTLFKLSDKWIDKVCSEVKHEQTIEVFHQFGITYFGGLFVVMMFWTALSVLVLISENLVSRFCARCKGRQTKAELEDTERTLFYINKNPSLSDSL